MKVLLGVEISAVALVLSAALSAVMNIRGLVVPFFIMIIIWAVELCSLVSLAIFFIKYNKEKRANRSNKAKAELKD